MKALRMFADHCVPTSMIHFLRDNRHEVLRLRDHIPAHSPDVRVIETAQEFEAILLSLNGDFADIITYPPGRYRGIIGIQVKNHPELIPRILDRLQRYLAEHPSMDHSRGKLFLVDVHRIRIRGSHE